MQSNFLVQAKTLNEIADHWLAMNQGTDVHEAVAMARQLMAMSAVTAVQVIEPRRRDEQGRDALLVTPKVIFSSYVSREGKVIES